jgi:DNA modification methylase
VTSPPYFGLRDYGHAGQIGLEATPDAFVAEMVAVFREVRRVLRDDGTLWLNLGDSYAGGGHSPNAPSSANSKSGKYGALGALKSGGLRPGNPTKNGGVSNRDGLQSEPGLKAKDLVGIPWRVAFALQADGWYLRQDIIWSKPNPMPESVTDRCTKAHEYIFLLSKSARYFYDHGAIREPHADSNTSRYAAIVANGGTDGPKLNKQRLKAGVKHPNGSWERSGIPGIGTTFGGWDASGKNKRSVWEVATQPFSEAHFATFPPALIEPCILAGCPEGGTVLDPFGGAGTTGLVADRLQRNAILIELNPEYAAMADRRIRGDGGMFAEVSSVSQADQGTP